MLQVWADLDGDGGLEAVSAYDGPTGSTLELYKHDGLRWRLTNRWTGEGYRILSMYETEEVLDRDSGNPATGQNPAPGLRMTWQVYGGPLSESLYVWENGGLTEVERYEADPAGGAEWSSLAARSEAALRGPGRFVAPVRGIGGVKYGYVDAEGKPVIPARFVYAYPFQKNGLAVVQLKDRAGVIDADGRYRVEPRYDTIESYSEGLAVASDARGYHVIDESGREVTSRSYSYISSYREGRALFSEMKEDGGASLYGYLDREGREVIPAAYQEGHDFQGGRALVRSGEKEFRLIGPKGKTLEVYRYAWVGPPGDGLLAYQPENGGKYGYLRTDGTVAIKPRFTGAQAFQDGRAVVNTADDYGSRYGLIDEKGRFVIQPGYNEIRPLGAGRWALGKPIRPDAPYAGSRYAIANRSGQVLSGFDYYDLTDYEQGYASAHDGKVTFFVDRSGRRAPGLPAVNGTGTLTLYGRGDGVGLQGLHQAVIGAQVDLRTSYLDRRGRVIWAENRVIPLSEAYRVEEGKFKPNRDYLVYYPVIRGMADAAAEGRVNAELKKLSAVKPVDPDALLESSYTGDYEVTFFRNRLVVLELNGYDYPFGAAHGMPTKVYAHVDLASGRFYQLADLFRPGSDYVKRLSDIVAAQIKNDPQYDYVWPDSYKGVRADQPFFVTEDALHVFFAPYEIAPYAAGFPTFRIPFRELEDLLLKEGAFWQSFH